MSDWCPRCKAFMFDPSLHTCLPAWEVWPIEESGKFTTTVHAPTARSAAEKWAEDYDNGDYTIVGGSPETVNVRRIVDGHVPPPIETFEVSGRSETVYTAKPVKEARGG